MFESAQTTAGQAYPFSCTYNLAGEPRSETNPTGRTVTTGQIRDPETGEDYFNARMFGSALGRFTSPDPGNAGADLYNPQSWNGYAYAGGNPMVNIDPSGQSFWSVLGNIFSFGLNVLFGGGGGPDQGGGINTTQVIIGAIGTGINIGTHAGGSGGSPGGTASAPPSAPPVSSFPGESLGIPSGMNLPGPFGIGSYDPSIIDGILPAPASFGAQANSNIARGLGYFVAGLRLWIGGSQTNQGSGTFLHVALPPNLSGQPGPALRYCGPGSAGGSPVNQADRACKQHDSCYNRARISAFTMYSPFLSAQQKQAMAACDAQLCSSVRTTIPNSRRESGDLFLVGGAFGCAP